MSPARSARTVSSGWPSSPPGCSAPRASQISLLTDDQVVAAGFGLSPGSVGQVTPLEESLCTVTAPRPAGHSVVRDAPEDASPRYLPPVTSGHVGAYLGAPLTDKDDRVIGTLCVFGPDAREWSDSDVATLRRLADSVVTELELSALVREYEGDRLRWGWRSTPRASAPSTGTWSPGSWPGTTG